MIARWAASRKIKILKIGFRMTDGGFIRDSHGRQHRAGVKSHSGFDQNSVARASRHHRVKSFDDGVKEVFRGSTGIVDGLTCSRVVWPIAFVPPLFNRDAGGGK